MTETLDNYELQVRNLLDTEAAPSGDDPNDNAGGTEEREKMFVRNVDMRMSILVPIYILNYIIRNNISSARLQGLEDELHLKGGEYDTLLSIFYVGYILTQVPSNLLLNHIGRPSIYLPICMIVWGTITILMGITTNFVGALLCQLFVGFAQAAFFPGAMFILSKWYKRNELGLRTALFAGSTFSNGFGALIASGILDHMGGKLGRASWRWLFYITGSLTILLSILAFFILPDFPATSKWLTPSERRLVEARLESDIGIAGIDDEELTALKGLIMALRDTKVWWLSLTLTSMAIALSFNSFFPTLIMEMGFNSNITLLLCAPPWVFATICSFVVARHSDAMGERFFHVVCPFLVGIVGFLIALSATNKYVCYLSLFLMAQSYSGFFTFYAWQSDSLPRPQSKRAASLAFINAFSQMGNIAGSYIWPKTWGPSYQVSYGICIAFSTISILMCYAFRRYLIRENGRLEGMNPGPTKFRNML